MMLPPSDPMSMRAAKWVLIVFGTLALLVVAALAVPVQLWRTGEVPQPELRHSPPERVTAKTKRVWIDADAASSWLCVGRLMNLCRKSFQRPAPRVG
ncbi:MAG: hypothetical protein ACKVQR_04105 [Aquabacterium sp.]